MFRNPVTDLIIALVVVLVIFGPKRLPSLGRGLGQGMKEFKDGITGKSGPAEDENAEKRALNSGETAPPAAPDAHDAAASDPAAGGADRGPAEVGSTEPRA
jgi:sec-independent protein translocase protein TatA